MADLREERRALILAAMYANLINVQWWLDATDEERAEQLRRGDEALAVVDRFDAHAAWDALAIRR